MKKLERHSGWRGDAEVRRSINPDLSVGNIQRVFIPV